MSAGIVIGFVAGVIIIVIFLGVIYILCKRHRLNRKRRRDVEHSDDDEFRPPAKKKPCIGNTILDFADETKGLPNVGETCYMNSMLQCLAWSPCLRLQLLDQIEKQKFSKHGNRVAKALLQILDSYHDDRDEETDDDDWVSLCCPIATNSIRSSIEEFLNAMSETNGRFGDGVQEDTFEFYNILLSTLQDEALENIPRSIKGDTHDEHIMRHCGTTRLFGGKFMVSYCYTACGHVDTVFQLFTSLSIPITKNQDNLSKPAVMLCVNDSEKNRVYYVPPKTSGKYGSLEDRDKLLDGKFPTPDYTDAESYPELEKQDVDTAKRIVVESSNISDPPKDKHLTGMSLVKENGNMKRTGVELGLEKLTETDTMNASDLTCRICNAEGKDGKEGVVYKQLQVASLPPVLVLQINRFKQRGRDVYKVNEQVSYPKFLDMTRFCSVAMEVSEAIGKPTPRGTYSLFGVVNHHGSMKGGHYFAYIKTNHRNVNHIQQQLQKHPWEDPEKMASDIRKHLGKIWRDEQAKANNADHKHEDMMHHDEDHQHQPSMTGGSDTWFNVSDSSVRRISEETVMQSEQAYILMYERI